MEILSLPCPFSKKFDSCEIFKKDLTIRQRILTIFVTAIAALLSLPLIGLGGIVAFRLMTERYKIIRLITKTVETVKVEISKAAKEHEIIDVRREKVTKEIESLQLSILFPATKTVETVKVETYKASKEIEILETSIVPSVKKTYTNPDIPISIQNNNNAVTAPSVEDKTDPDFLPADGSPLNYSSYSGEEDLQLSFIDPFYSKNKNPISIQNNNNVDINNDNNDVKGNNDIDDDVVIIPSEMERSWFPIKSDTAQDLDSILTYKPGGIIDLNPDFSEKCYEDLLDIVDQSYNMAKAHTVGPNKQDAVTLRQDILTGKLSARGWNDSKILFGKTGKFNRNDDAVGIILINKKENLVYVVFHGSRNGSKLPGDDDGDWGANRDTVLADANLVRYDDGKPVQLDDVGKPVEGGKIASLYGAPEGVKVHRGFALNFISVQDQLLQHIDSIVRGMDNPLIIASGHSKGGAIAAIAMPVIQSYLNKNKLKARLNGVLISSPMAFDQNGANWVYSLSGIRKIIRPKVRGDVVTASLWNNYVHIGIPLKDSVVKVRERTLKLNGTLGYFEMVINYHYAACREGSMCFVPEIVMRRHELLEAYEAWVREYKGNVYDIPGFPPEEDESVLSC